jgi:hypothetical protein
MDKRRGDPIARLARVLPQNNPRDSGWRGLSQVASEGAADDRYGTGIERRFARYATDTVSAKEFAHRKQTTSEKQQATG